MAVLYYARAPMRTGGDENDLAVQLGVARTAVEVPLALASGYGLVRHNTSYMRSKSRPLLPVGSHP